MALQIFMFHLNFNVSDVLKKHMDPYEILKISPLSSLSQIKKAYYSLAKIHHPDKTHETDNYDNFLQLKEAFKQLSDDQERHYIDCFRLTRDAVIQDEITIDELEYEDGVFIFDCRCGGIYELDALDYTNARLNIVENQSFFAYCESCSGACEITQNLS